MALDVVSVAKEFSLTEEAVERESLRAFLLQQCISSGRIGGRAAPSLASRL